MSSKITKQKSIFLRNFVFGVEDSLVSTVGLLSGVASAGVNQQTIFLTGMVLIFVEAISMAVGSFLSEQSVEEYESKKDISSAPSKEASAIMFISYFVSGFIPLFPYAMFEVHFALVISIISSLAALFILGFISALFFRRHILRHAFQMLILGGVAIAAGVIIGKITTN